MSEEKYLSCYTTVNGLRYHYKVAGPENGRLVLLLHGFPEFWYGWRHQIDALAEAGFRVVAPDQRGYNETEKPRGIKNYDTNILVEDVVGLMDHLGADKVFLAGHDWGANVAWQMAITHPERVKRLAIMNVPHPLVMIRHLKNDGAQRRRSWYMFFFQLPLLPELGLGLANHAGGVDMLKKSSNPDTFSDEDLSHYRQAWGQPRAWTGMINWYRALRVRQTGKGRMDMQVKPPTLIIWGEQDLAFVSGLAEESLALCEDGRLELVPEATHWVQHDAAGKVNDWLADFFSKQS